MKRNKPGKSSVANWHPNFRVVEKLPDTKVIRTAFLINTVAVTILLLVSFALIWRERELSEISAKIGDVREGGLKKEIADLQPKLDQVVKLQREFSATEKKVREIESFVTTPLVASEFLRQISQTLPRLTVISGVDFRGQTVTLRGSLVGASERATALAKNYVERLSHDPSLAVRICDVRLNNLERSQATGRLTFEIEMKLKPQK
jgi:Tfp pilus assembly protein PilN